MSPTSEDNELEDGYVSNLDHDLSPSAVEPVHTQNLQTIMKAKASVERRKNENWVMRLKHLYEMLANFIKGRKESRPKVDNYMVENGARNLMGSADVNETLSAGVQRKVKEEFGTVA